MMRLLVAPALLLLLGLTACGKDPAAVRIDVSQSHTPRDVGWPEPDFEDVQIQPVASVRIKLPRGVVFAPDVPINDVIMNRDGEYVEIVQVFAEKSSASAAHALATRWAKQFDLSTRGLDEWYESRRRGGDPLERAQAGGFDRLGGKDGPIPIVRIEYSADDALPSVATFELQWVPPDPADGPGL